MRTFRISGLAGICILSASCVTTNPQVTPPTDSATTPVASAAGKARQADTVTAFEIRGAMAAKKGSKGWSAAVNWAQQGASTYQIRLMGPLGGGTVVITRSGNAVTWQDGPKRVSGSNADKLLAEQTGVQLPVQNLYYWVRGLPAPGKVTSERRDAANHLLLLEQGGYAVEYGGYTSVQGVDLPSRIRLQGHGIMVKLVIKRWATR